MKKLAPLFILIIALFLALKVAPTVASFISSLVRPILKSPSFAEVLTTTPMVIAPQAEMVRVVSPQPNTLVASPLLVEGEARGTWFFEASFPAQIVDADGAVLGTGIMQAKSEWMTADFVPFSGTIEFSKPTTSLGVLLLKKDNPSGLQEYDASVYVPVRLRRPIDENR